MLLQLLYIFLVWQIILFYVDVLLPHDVQQFDDILCEVREVKNIIVFWCMLEAIVYEAIIEVLFFHISPQVALLIFFKDLYLLWILFDLLIAF